MFNRGKLWIIPNDDIMEDLYYKQIETGKSHLTAIQEFVDKYKLEYKYKEEDYQIAPVDMAVNGNLVIKSDDDSKILIFYIPKIITDRQLEYFENNEIAFYNAYSKIAGFSIEEDTILPEHGILEIKKAIFKKNKKIDIFK